VPALIIDANLSILLMVGLTNREYISRHKRLSAYDAIDFDIISGIVAKSSGVVFTPNVLSETSNLIRYVTDPMRTEICRVMAEVVARAEERYITSQEAMRRHEYGRLGLTDSVLLALSETGGNLLTADLDLYLAALSAGFHVTNYMHIKGQRPDFAD